MSLRNLSQRNGEWIVNGEPKQCWIGRDSFKLANMLSKYFAGQDGQKWLVMAERWIEHNQRLLGEDVILRVFGETGDWADNPMFGGEPIDAGIWDLEDLRKRAAEGRRIKELTPLNKKVIDWLMKASHETGCAIEYVVDATLKHTEGLTTAITDHAIRQTAEYMRKLWMEKYPLAKIIMEARNEWRAHNKMKTKLHDVNMWANRFYRWEREVDGDVEHRLRFVSPGPEWTCRQWPEGYIIVDGTDDGVLVGTEPGRYKMGCTHPSRNPTDREWWELPTDMERLRADCRGTPLGFNESMMYVDADDAERARQWYRAKGYTTKLNRYMQWYEAATQAVNYFIIHDEKGMQCDTEWPRRVTRLEVELGGTSPSPPPDPPEPGRVSYRRIVTQAYREIFGRAPDPGGLEYHNARMRDEGVTEAELREGFIRSKEFENKNKE